MPVVDVRKPQAAPVMPIRVKLYSLLYTLLFQAVSVLANVPGSHYLCMLLSTQTNFASDACTRPIGYYIMSATANYVLYNGAP